MRQPARLARKVINTFLQTVNFFFNLNERNSLILVRAVGSGLSSSGVFVLLVAVELAQIGEVLVHAKESIIARIRTLTVTYNSFHPALNRI